MYTDSRVERVGRQACRIPRQVILDCRLPTASPQQARLPGAAASAWHARPALRAAMQLLVAGAAVAAFQYFVDWRQVFQSLVRIDAGQVFVALLAMFASLLVATWKWARLLQHDHPGSLGFLRLFRLNCVALFYGTLLPGQIVGDAAKVVRLSRHRPHMARAALASVAFDRITAVLGLVTLATACALFDARDNGAVLLTLIAAVGALSGVVMWLRTRREGEQSENGHASPVRWRLLRGALGRLAAQMGSYVRNGRLFMFALVASVVVQMLLTLHVVIFAEGLGLHIGFVRLAWVFAIVTIVQALPVTPAGIGTRDTALLVLLASADVAANDAIALSVCVLFGTLVAAVVGGISELGDIVSSGRSTRPEPVVAVSTTAGQDVRL